MRPLAAIVVSLVSFACASSHTATPSLRQQCEASYSTIWIAAQSAMLGLEARVVSANQDAGTIHGRMEADIYGAPIELSASIRRTPSMQPGTVEPVWVEVRTWDPSTDDPDPDRLSILKAVARQYLELVRQRAPCGGPM
jgi:hypothetical protein